jgi:hypothetical protein
VSSLGLGRLRDPPVSFLFFRVDDAIISSHQASRELVYPKKLFCDVSLGWWKSSSAEHFSEMWPISLQYSPSHDFVAA